MLCRGILEIDFTVYVYYSAIQIVAISSVCELFDLGRFEQMRIFLKGLFWRFIGEIGIDLTSISSVSHLGDEGRHNLPGK